jgi:hypothetical protein
MSSDMGPGKKRRFHFGSETKWEILMHKLSDSGNRQSGGGVLPEKNPLTGCVLIF